MYSKPGVVGEHSIFARERHSYCYPCAGDQSGLTPATRLGADANAGCGPPVGSRSGDWRSNATISAANIRRLSQENTIVKATSTVQVDNERAIVTEWRFAPGAATGHHVHAHDYGVVPLTSGMLRLEEGDDVTDAALVLGASYSHRAGVAHNVINVNDYEFRFVEIEFK